MGAIFIFWLGFQIRFNYSTATFGPTILTTAGIFGTFLGIAIGLLHFDSHNIAASVPELLDGIKMAFWASVVGVGCALSIKVRYLFLGLWPNKLTPETHDETTASDLAAILKDILKALAGSELISVVSTLTLLRQNTNDKLDALKAAQTEALQKLSELGSKQLVEALRETIRDFNEKLTVQFGDNFKELNVAVGRLLSWQEHYKEEIEAATERLRVAGDASEQIAKSYASVLENSAAFSSTATDLKHLLSALETQKQQLAQLAANLAKLFVSASESLPKVEQQISQLTAQLTKAVTDNQTELSAAFRENVTALRNTLEAQGERLKAINEEHNKHVSEMMLKTKQQVGALDEALSKELEKALLSLGDQLTALSRRFVDDYAPLTERLRLLVQTGRVNGG